MLNFTKKPNSSAMGFLLAGSFWFIAGTFYGFISATDLVSPEFFNNIPGLVFGRARPAHVNTVLYGFVTSTLIGAGLYYLPALLKRTLWSEPLGWAAFVFWNLTVLSGPVSFSLGESQGREYCEYLWLFDVSFMLAFLLTAVNLIMTIIKRVEKKLDVAVWYFAATFLWAATVYPIGNVMWNPPEGAVAHGVIDNILLWFYGHNLPGLILTPLAVGAAYFVIPHVSRSPVFSYTLSLIGFWSLVTLYSHIGGHHLMQAPIPNWLKVISVIDSTAMIIPVFAATGNLLFTIRGHGGRVLRNPAGRFVLIGLVWYLITCIQGPLQSIPQFQRTTHFNNWVIGHSHIAVLGFAGFIALGALWFIVPYILKRRLYSDALVNLQFGLVTIGLTGFAIDLTIAGLIQGSAWNNGEVVYRVLPQFRPEMIVRAGLGVFIFGSAVVGFVNLILTIYKGKPHIPPSLEEIEAEQTEELYK